MQTKPLQNDQEIAEFMLETDEELSDLSDLDFEDIMDATYVSSYEEFLSNMTYHHNQILILLAFLHQRNIVDQDKIMLKRLRKVQMNTVNYVGHWLNLLSPWEYIYLMNNQL